MADFTVTIRNATAGELAAMTAFTAKVSAERGGAPVTMVDWSQEHLAAVLANILDDVKRTTARAKLTEEELRLLGIRG